MQLQRRIMMLPSIMKISMLITVLLTASFASTVFIHTVVAIYAQDSNSNNSGISGFGNTTNLSLPNGKSIP
jgi:hypothetical protein